MHLGFFALHYRTRTAGSLCQTPQATGLLYMKTGGKVERYFKSGCAPWRTWLLPNNSMRVLLAQAELTILLQHPTKSPVPPRWSLYTEEVFGSSSLLTFILFWTLGYNIVYLF